MRSVATLAVAASHEINNPLMALVASLELLERTQTPNAYGQARPERGPGRRLGDQEVRQLGRITRLEHAVG
jgi:signal transduction histidine kinase